MEAVNVSLANFVDMLIDYPNSKLYAFDLFDKLVEMEVMAQEQCVRYKQHLTNIEEMEYSWFVMAVDDLFRV